MGLLSYVILLYLNSSFFVKFTLWCFLFLFLYVLSVAIANYKEITRYKRELLSYLTALEDNTIDLKQIYNNMYLKSNRNLLTIFFSGIKKTICLQKFGVCNFIESISVIKYDMDIKMLKEIIQLKNNIHIMLKISNLILFLSIIVFIINVLAFSQKMNIYFYQTLPLNIFFSGINEIIFPLMTGFMLAFLINFVYYKCSTLIYSLVADYFASINQFTELLYNEFNFLN